MVWLYLEAKRFHVVASLPSTPTYNL
jgi:hypothetical protein